MVPDLDDAWKKISQDEIDALRRIIRGLEKSADSTSICDQAAIHSYDLRNFLAEKSRRPRPKTGVRLMAFAARKSKNDIPSDLHKDYDTMKEAARRIFEFDADDDFFFRHINRLRVMDARLCKEVVKAIHGNYYMYRMSAEPNMVLRSHVAVADYNPFDRLPHFVNQAKFGKIDERKAPMRRSEGQILSVNATYVFVGFVFDNFEGPSVNPCRGLKFIIVPSVDLNAKDRRAKGFFASYTHGRGDKYEYGPMCLVRTQDSFSETRVGEFPIERLSVVEPTLHAHDIKYNVADIVDQEHFLSAALTMTVFGPR